MAQIRQGRLRALAVTSKKRVSLVPDIPTVAESGYPKYEFNLWNGLLVPAKTPKDTIAAIHNAVVTALKAPEASKRLTDMSSTVIANQPEEFGAFLKSEVDSIASVVKKLNLTAEATR